MYTKQPYRAETCKISYYFIIIIKLLFHVIQLDILVHAQADKTSTRTERDKEEYLCRVP
jgi:hypothetical protein